MGNKTESIKAALAEATVLVVGLPEELKEAAFPEVYRDLRGHAAVAASGRSRVAEESESSEVREHEGGQAPAVEPRVSPAVVSEFGSTVQKAIYAVVVLQERGELSTQPAMRTVIEEELATKSGGGSFKTALKDNTPKYFTRARRDGVRGYVYTATDDGIAHLNGLKPPDDS